MRHMREIVRLGVLGFPSMRSPDGRGWRRRRCAKTLKAALAAGVPRGVVLADAGYGIDTAFRIAGAGLDLRRRHPVLDKPLAAW